MLTSESLTAVKVSFGSIASALLATMSKRKLGLQFKEAVITSLTAFSRSRGSLSNKTVDSAVDFVFDDVFDKDMVLNNLIQDEFL